MYAHFRCLVLGTCLISLGCEGTTGGLDTMPSLPNGVQVTFNSEGEIDGLFLESEWGDGHTNLLNWLRRSPKQLRTLRVESGAWDDRLMDALGDLSQLEWLTLDGQCQLLSSLCPRIPNAKGVTLTVSPQAVGELLHLQALPSLSKLFIEFDDDVMTAHKISIDFLSGLPISTLRITTPYELVFDDSTNFQGLAQLTTLELRGNCESWIVDRMLFRAPIKIIGWYRHWRYQGANEPESRDVWELGRLGDWSQLIDLHLDISPFDTVSARQWMKGGACFPSVEIRPNQGFHDNMRLAPQLESLYMRFIAVPEAGWVALSRLPRLNSLTIACCNFDNASAESLIESNSLQFFHLITGEVSRDTVERLHHAIEYVTIEENVVVSSP